MTSTILPFGLVADAPAVSVLMAVRNGEPYLSAALESLSRQTFTDFEIILVDNGSTDATPQLIETWRQREPRLRTTDCATPCLSRSLSLAASLARGRYLARLDADDIAEPHRLARQVAEMEADPELVLLGSQARIIDAAGRRHGRRRALLHDGELRKRLIEECAFVHSSVIMRRAAFEAAGGYRASLRAGEDYDLWTRMAAVGRIANLAEPLVQYRIHPKSLTKRQPKRFAIARTCVVAAQQARLLGQPEPFIRGAPYLRGALRILGVSPVEFRRKLLRRRLYAAYYALPISLRAKRALHGLARWLGVRGALVRLLRLESWKGMPRGATPRPSLVAGRKAA